MFKALEDVLHNRQANYMAPFFWMRDHHHEDLLRRMESVYQSGCRALCVESRTHEGFCEESWWADMDLILSECRKRDMRVWILDDKHFPTGLANEIIAKKYPEKRRWFLREYHVDVYGPMKGASLFMRPADEEDALLGAFAIKRSGTGEALLNEYINITGGIDGGRAYFDVPEGVWRVFFLYKTRRGSVNGHGNYIHYIDPDSVDALIEAVYEPHYEHYREYFGNTLAGFFSDEPQFGNNYIDWRGDVEIPYKRSLGKPGLALPWSDRLLENMNAALGESALPMLAGLWYPMQGVSPRVRYAYMDKLTRLWRENFSYKLGNWCEERNVLYIGHIIEDNNANSRLGYSAGHYFRALDGQHMAGIDVVLHQIVPGIHQMIHTASISGGTADNEFFHYVLAKLASSHAHIQPRKAGRAMCEVFGAYGWAEGVPMMKHLMDHMLVRGINYFVPHAYSPDFPDRDCPPHFGLYGTDPQARPFETLMDYSNKVCHLLYPAKHRADAAILYHAEAEWCDNDILYMQKPAKTLYTHQVDYDIVPLDSLKEAKVANRELVIGAETYRVLIVPGARALSEDAVLCLTHLKAQGLPIWFVGFRPEALTTFEVIAEDALEKRIRAYSEVAIFPERDCLSLYRCEREDGSIVVMAVNESLTEAYDGQLFTPYGEGCVRLDLLLNRVRALPIENRRVPLRLAPGQSAIFVFGNALIDAPCADASETAAPFLPEWEIAVREPDGEYETLCRTSELFDITKRADFASFAGFVRYKARFAAENAQAYKALRLGEVGMTAEVRINGVSLGQRICAPYEFDVSGALKAGENELEIVVANSLAGKVRDSFSTFLQVPRTGLLGPVEWIL